MKIYGAQTREVRVRTAAWGTHNREGHGQQGGEHELLIGGAHTSRRGHAQ
jgi:hypothetical protein